MGCAPSGARRRNKRQAEHTSGEKGDLHGDYSVLQQASDSSSPRRSTTEGPADTRSAEARGSERASKGDCPGWTPPLGPKQSDELTQEQQQPGEARSGSSGPDSDPLHRHRRSLPDPLPETGRQPQRSDTGRSPRSPLNAHSSRRLRSATSRDRFSVRSCEFETPEMDPVNPPTLYSAQGDGASARRRSTQLTMSRNSSRTCQGSRGAASFWRGTSRKGSLGTNRQSNTTGSTFNLTGTTAVRPVDCSPACHPAADHPQVVSPPAPRLSRGDSIATESDGSESETPTSPRVAATTTGQQKPGVHSGFPTEDQMVDPFQCEAEIDRVRDEMDTHMDLAATRLHEFPGDVLDIEWLVKLDVGENQISELPDGVGGLQHLEFLNASSNHLHAVPSTLGKLAKLQTLLLDHNEISSLPDSLRRCEKLQTIGLDWNQLTEFPVQLCEITGLEKIFMTENTRVRSLPPLEKMQQFAKILIVIDNPPSLRKQVEQWQPSLPGVAIRWHKVYPDKVTDFIYIGSLRSAQSPEVYKELNIGFIATIGRSLAVVLGDGVEQLELTVDDNPGETLITHFELVHEFLEKSRESGKGVLVHCFAGLSRSATMVISYLMRYYHMALDEALEYVRQSRPAVQPNAGFMEQLKRYEKVLSERETAS